MYELSSEYRWNEVYFAIGRHRTREIFGSGGGGRRHLHTMRGRGRRARRRQGSSLLSRTYCPLNGTEGVVLFPRLRAYFTTIRLINNMSITNVFAWSTKKFKNFAQIMRTTSTPRPLKRAPQAGFIPEGRDTYDQSNCQTVLRRVVGGARAPARSHSEIDIRPIESPKIKVTTCRIDLARADYHWRRMFLEYGDHELNAVAWDGQMD
ncbi:hypothetical protein EVAR_89670_1 [Eumeta japonica]|uniref:Uncharacterized protein n=1 Tax=Eumeta variegata TaxID=151549 RepID=A0A4C1YC75_EUMVA|nr:hypothetical protein EVAR_89670_1 [Eumeta japonica]